MVETAPETMPAVGDMDMQDEKQGDVSQRVDDLYMLVDEEELSKAATINLLANSSCCMTSPSLAACGHARRQPRLPPQICWMP